MSVDTMTIPDAAALQEALSHYAEDHGLAATYALILDSATDADLAKVSAPLGDLRNSTGHRVGLGPQQRTDIMHALGAMLNLYEHVDATWPGEIHVYGGIDASSIK